MDVLAIGVQDHIDSVRTRLAGKVRALCEKGIGVDMTERTCGPVTFLCLNLRDSGHGIPSGQRDVLRYHVASALADAIVADVERGLVAKTVHDRYPYFDEAERRKIAAIASGIIHREGNGACAGVDEGAGQESTAGQCSRHSILCKVLDYLDTSSTLILEGFVRFRLKGYVDEIRSAAEAAVDDFMLEREYNEFVRLLKYFVDVQEPKVDEVHVIVRAGGLFRLVDRNGDVVDNEYLEGFAPDLADVEIDYEDLLISALITVSPRRVVLHLGKDQEAAETVRKIFESRVSVCPGCRLCEGRPAIGRVPGGTNADKK